MQLFAIQIAFSGSARRGSMKVDIWTESASTLVPLVPLVPSEVIP
jgi:hypothetical protein